MALLVLDEKLDVKFIERQIFSLDKMISFFYAGNKKGLLTKESVP